MAAVAALMLAAGPAPAFNACANQSCWNSQIAQVIAQVPVVTGEIGESDCGGGASVTVNSQSYNGAIAASGTTTFGFTGTYTANDTAPSGLVCTAH